MYDIFYLGKPGNYFYDLKEKFPSLRAVNSFNEAKKKTLTKFFWLIPNDIIILEDFKFDYVPDDWSQDYIHVFKNTDNWYGVLLFPRRSNPSEKELNNRTFAGQKQIDINASKSKPYDVFEIDTYDEYLYAVENSTTEMFWMSSRNIAATIPDIYFTHDNEYDRKQNHAFLHRIDSETSHRGVFLCSVHAPLSKKEIEFRHLIKRKDWDLEISKPKPYDVFEIDTYDEYLYALESSYTDMIWVISKDIELTDRDILNISYQPQNMYDKEFEKERKLNHTYLHKVGDKTYNDAVWLLSKNIKISKNEFKDKILKNAKHHEKIVGVNKPYDMVFISYQEPNADENYHKILEKFPKCKRVHGVKGIHQAHIEAAKQCSTSMFWIVDADALIVDNFNFDYIAPKWDLDAVHVWRSQNPINDLVYGYGGVKLFPRQLTIDMDASKPDMTTSITNKFKAMPIISNITAFNTDPFNTWRSAFRECCKLSSKIIDRQKDDETNQRLDIWCTVGEDRPYGKYAIAGAKAGAAYGAKNKGNIEALKKINDFEWLKCKFDAEYNRN